MLRSPIGSDPALAAAASGTTAPPPSAYCRLAASLAYEGSPFHGFARQEGLLTVQGSLEEALSLLAHHEIETVCAGRTDAGVHGRGQVVSFDFPRSLVDQRGLRSLARSLNALTHDQIAIRDLVVKAPDFSARFSARYREYRYFIACSSWRPVIVENLCWHHPAPLDLDAMRKAAAYLRGEHDFASFCRKESARGKVTVREIYELSLAPCSYFGMELLAITVRGNAFLHSMVRSIVGSLVAVGCHRRDPSWIREVLAAKDRDAAGESAPAHGLVLWSVAFDDLSSSDHLTSFRADPLSATSDEGELDAKGTKAGDAQSTGAESAHEAGAPDFIVADTLGDDADTARSSHGVYGDAPLDAAGAWEGGESSAPGSAAFGPSMPKEMPNASVSKEQIPREGASSKSTVRASRGQADTSEEHPAHPRYQKPADPLAAEGEPSLVIEVSVRPPYMATKRKRRGKKPRGDKRG